MNPYWICAHLKLVKFRHNSLLKFVDFFPHESLLNWCASKATQNWTWILTETCGQFSRMNPFWICAHLKLVKIGHESLLNFVYFFSSKMLHGEVAKSSIQHASKMLRCEFEIEQILIHQFIHIHNIQTALKKEVWHSTDSFAIWFTNSFTFTQKVKSWIW